jgi:4-amino-4-deoxy-L-arabinose transferase-like glycosyltransferase
MAEFRGSSVCAKLQGRRYKLSLTLQPQAEAAASPAQRIGWAILILVTLCICYFSQLGVIGFVGPDEPRYAWIARDMAETGDWVTPRLYGKPWFEKPPLLYWGGAIFFKLLGEGHPEVAARLPSAISALLATLALAWLALRAYGEDCARWLLLLLPTSVGMIGFSHAAATDMPFAGMLTIAMVCVAAALGLLENENTPILPRTPWRALLLFGFFLGLAVLAKGPAAIILSGGGVFFWAILTKRWRDAFRLLHPAAVVAFCVTALPWYTLCAHRNPDFFHVFIIEHNFKRYLTPEFQHMQPFGYYVPILLVAFVPWSLLLLVAAGKGLSEFYRTHQISPLVSLILSWIVFSLLFFSASKSKLPGYVLPTVPAIGFLFSRILSASTLLKRRTAGLTLAFSGVFFLCASAYLQLQLRSLIPIHLHRLQFDQTVTAFVLAFMFSAITLCAGASFWPRANSITDFLLRAASVLALAFLIESSPVIVLRTQTILLSGKALAIAASHLPPGAQLRVMGFRRDYRYALNFYLHREIPDWRESPIRDGFVFTNGFSCKDIYTVDSCANLWANVDLQEDWSLLKITPALSLDRPSGGRQPQQKE